MALLAVTACSATHPRAGTSATATNAPPPSTSSAGPRPLVASLPDACDGVTPDRSAVVAFVAGGRAWAVSPDDASTLHCLFSVSGASLFSWGPQGDRVVLAGLEVRGVGSPVSRPGADLHPSYYSWSRPTGTTVVFTDQTQHALLRADVGSAATRDITPVPGETYGDIAYHPSGLAIGFVGSDPVGSSIWMATNLGQNPVRLVRAESKDTTFGHIVYAHDGISLYYSVDKPGGVHTLARYNLPSGKVDPSLWSGQAPINDITELAGVAGVALTVGSMCGERQALFSALDGTSGQNLLPGVPGPVSVVGRLDADRFVVAVGGCNGSSDLYLARLSGKAPTLLARSVDTAAVRIPEPTPPPPLPSNLPRSGFA